MIVQMSSFQKKLAVHWQKRLQYHQEVRNRNCCFWRKTVPQGLIQVCSGEKQGGMIRFPVLVKSVDKREQICLQSEQRGYGIMPAYPTPINEIPLIAMEFEGQSYPNAKQLADCLMTLPVHEYIKESDILKIEKILPTN